jgi:hypothetical protein
MTNRVRNIRKLRIRLVKSGFRGTETEITNMAVRVAGSVEGYLGKLQVVARRPLPQMSDTAMQSPKWTDSPVYRRIGS